MSLFAAGTALATQSGVSAGTAMAAGAAAEIIVGTANYQEFTEPEAHVLMNPLHDAADIASAHTSNLRPAAQEATCDILRPQRDCCQERESY